MLVRNTIASLETPQEITTEVLIEKYAKGSETTVEEVQTRVAEALSEVENGTERTRYADQFLWAMQNGFIPAGRVSSAAGTGLATTLINCFVQPVGDSITNNVNGKPGIYTALAEAAETMRRGGGVGYNFSAIRPRGARVKGTGSSASGPLSYMKVFDRSCETVESAGARRGAQMAVLNVDHPDVISFITAKQEKGQFNNFNVSVGVTDAFMRAVEANGDYELIHLAEPTDELKAAGAYKRSDGMWVYQKENAAKVWDLIMKCTYEAAEPGVLFLDQLNRENNLAYCEVIEATNPCVTADTWVATAEGPKQVRDLIDQPFVALINGQEFASAPEGFFATGEKPVLRLRTREGHALRLTANHLVRRVAKQTRYRQAYEWVEAGQLVAGDKIALHNHRAAQGWEGQYNEAQGYLLGLLLGDGTLKSEAAIISVWHKQATAFANGYETAICKNSVMLAAEAAMQTMKTRSDFAGFMPIAGRDEYRMKSAGLRDLAIELGMHPGAKKMTDAFEATSSDFYAGFLRGLFDADGSVQGSQQKGVSVRLTQVDKTTLERVQRMLQRLGIVSTIYANRKGDAPAMKSLPDGKGGFALYQTQIVHELVISGDNLAVFESRIGFADEDKQGALVQALGNYRRALNSERFIATVEALEADGTETVYDVQVPGINAFDANGFYVHNCGEQPLPDYGCCCLGSLNLTAYVKNPFSEDAGFDFDLFERVTKVAVRMLDNVLTATQWPLEEQAREAAAKRRIGLGFTGLGDALIMLNVRYDKPEGRELARKISEVMRDSSYWGSVELAKERGAFPLLDVEQYLKGGFASRLPDDLKDAIRVQGIRNSHLTSIAPTGTISLAFADNASNGIEPAFSWFYNRTKRMPDGTKKDYTVEDHAFRVYRAMGHDVNNLPEAFVSALEISAIDHMLMVAVVAPYIDAAISKTVNVPEDYPYEEFKDLYMEAWHKGLKGITTYRPNNILGSVLSVPAANTEPTSSKPITLSEHDRRMILQDATMSAPLASLRWPSRPSLPAGASAWVSEQIQTPQGEFAVAVSDHGGIPFEVWVLGGQPPRGLDAIAKTLSSDMRANDRGWLNKRFSMLEQTYGDPFWMPMPPNGDLVQVPSATAAMAKLVRWRYEQLGALQMKDSDATPVLDALFSAHEPKTGADGTLAWVADVRNPSTEDEFVLMLKELQMPDGTRRPYSMGLSGGHPPALDGLCKILSVDMRVVDPAWIGMKLRKLLNYAEPLGDFLARVPGTQKQMSYPSTVAYIAQLVIHRYAMLGILNEEGLPTVNMGVVAEDPKRHAAKPAPIIAGKLCRECGNMAMIRKDGCDFCTACGAIGSCG
ncbi:MAG: ribonucleoside-diphosphate reductase, adenosylcobalamin-dependent [Oxalobacter sp.]|nr:MAG: ribonucleoside-diphosphate reductase, adenosylcobalamin-dependent [Oxalobacter sp.]